MALELLAPARDAEQGILALRCGADALYMGPSRFGARQSAGCDIKAFEHLTREARLWGARVYATLNTVLFDNELEDARRLAWQLYEAGVNALIIQDMALLELDLPPIPLHASTQTACDSPQKVAFLASVGLSRAILARELSLSEIEAIHRAADIELEAFVFGALCVSESGHCYLSGAMGGRSGNRGACAQPCRAPWNLVDASGRILIQEKHLLSIQDLDLSDYLEQMAIAGICSFKIEGRLKDADYVKNVVGYLRKKLDHVLEKRPEFTKASLGQVKQDFQPDPTKTFQRGLNTYRIDGQRHSIKAIGPGHLGEFVGVVRSIGSDRLILDTKLELHPGDGLAFIDGNAVAGTFVNAVETSAKAGQGLQVFVQDPSRIQKGTTLYRNVDHHWLKTLRGAKIERRIAVDMTLLCEPDRVTLRLVDESGLIIEVLNTGNFEQPVNLEKTSLSTRKALGRMGDSPFEIRICEIQNLRFVPVSQLNALRREAVQTLEEKRRDLILREPRRNRQPNPAPLPAFELDFEWNIANKIARNFYEIHGGKVIEDAAEHQKDMRGRIVMTTRHCLRYELGWCPAHPNLKPWLNVLEPKGEIFLEKTGTKLKCIFDCKSCRMKLQLI